MKVAEAAMQERESSHNMPAVPTLDDVVDAMITADHYSKAYKKERG